MPMYTVCLCIYYVCKLKHRMSDGQFSQRLEKKMHIVIVTSNLGVYLTALAMGAINPSPLGTGCLAASLPTGCSHRPEIFGECDPSRYVAVRFFIALSNLVVPVLSILGIIMCISMIFWHVLKREVVFATRGSSGALSMLDTAPRGVENGRVIPGGYVARRNRQQQTRDLVSTSDPPSSAVGALSSLERSNPVALADSNASSRILWNDTNQDENNIAIPESASIPIQASSSGTTASRHPQEDSAAQGTSDVNESGNWSNHGGINFNVFPSNNSDLSFSNLPSIRDDSGDANTTTPTPTNVDAESLSRLYKKELLKQVCCHVLVFCLTNLPYLIMVLQIVSGIMPSRVLMRANAVLYPLAGFFNIIIYTRWNVASYRRKHPECSRFQAFCVVLKAGGDLPQE